MPTPEPTASPPSTTWTTYEKLVVAILAFLQFTVVVDFMILAPLGAVLIVDLGIDAAQFGATVSAFAICGGLSSFASATFADRFDRKRLLLVFYAGFLVGTALCGVAPTYEALLATRVVTGVFGGVLGSIVMAIITDVFPLARRGRVMGVVMTSLSAAQIAGVPIGLVLSNRWGWHAPFLVIAGLGAVVGVVVAIVLQPITGHLAQRGDRGALAHLARTAARPAHLLVFGTTVLLASGFMLMPLASAFFVHNLHVAFDELPTVYLVTGAVTFVVGPLSGKLADRFGRLPIIVAGSALAATLFVVWSGLAGPTALAIVVVVNALVSAANAARMVSVGALVSTVPAPTERGAFMSLNTAIQQLAGGAFAAVGGLFVVVRDDGGLDRFDVLCLVVAASIVLTILPLWVIDRRARASAIA